MDSLEIPKNDAFEAWEALEIKQGWVEVMASEVGNKALSLAAGQ